MILQYSLRQPIIGFAGAHPDQVRLELRGGSGSIGSVMFVAT
jgi:hypothetical protein